ncbi:uncharacterized protein TM35_000292570 [Trypanosoma theileri]|uniref:Cyclic nucleotide-binding domain-containing protein n=1 Tax=Trypanosoma theileri TaxID=67003 RepID=A0A1X0NNU6_9TRYP|nr:uncharacterized protein TM35_000292570 [Trypanosoma theileri]ORC86375.1 hypothetical protein TM35_000292570 [Trypanosoma theileri]
MSSFAEAKDVFKKGQKISLTPRVTARLLLKLKAARRRLDKLAALRGDPQLSADRLRSSPLFNHWPLSALSEIRQKMVLEVYRKGDVIVYSEEPSRVSSLFWIVSGKLTEVLGKSEMYFMESTEPNSDSTPVEKNSNFSFLSKTYPLNLPDSLMRFSAGQFATGERLFLGVGYRRTIRCESGVIVFQVPFTVVKDIQKKWGVPLETTLIAAKEIVKRQMSRANEKPSLESALFHNPVLRGMDTSTLGILWIRLSPLVICKDETLCADVFTSDRIYFLQSGRMRVPGRNSGRGQDVVSSGSSFGLNSFVQFEAPYDYGEQRRVVASRFSQLWGITLSAFMEIVSENEWKRCAEIAKKTIQFGVDYKVLRKSPVLSHLPESAAILLAKRMQLRVVRPGECILTADECPCEAIIVLIGATYVTKKRPFAEGSADEKVVKKSVSCGVPLAVAECVSERRIKYGLFASTAAIIFSLTHNAIMDIVNECKEVRDVTVITEAAITQLDGPKAYRSAEQIVNKAQDDAAQRVKRYANEQNSKMELLNAENNKSDSKNADVDVDRIIQLRAQVLSTLSTQVCSLRPSMWGMGKIGLQYDVASSSVMRDVQHENSKNSRRTKSCFTIDEKGRVVFCEDGAVSVGNLVHTEKKTPLTKMMKLKEETKEGEQKGYAESIAPPQVLLKRDIAKNIHRTPHSSALRCVPHVKFTAVTARSPASQRVMALRVEAEKLQDETDKVLSLPLGFFSARQRGRGPPYASM